MFSTERARHLSSVTVWDIVPYLHPQSTNSSSQKANSWESAAVGKGNSHRKHKNSKDLFFTQKSSLYIYISGHCYFSVCCYFKSTSTFLLSRLQTVPGDPWHLHRAAVQSRSQEEGMRSPDTRSTGITRGGSRGPNKSSACQDLHGGSQMARALAGGTPLWEWESTFCPPQHIVIYGKQPTLWAQLQFHQWDISKRLHA